MSVFGDLGFGAGLVINDKQGNPQVKIAVSNVFDSAYVMLKDSNNRDRIVIEVDKDAPSIDLKDNNQSSVCLIACASTEWAEKLHGWGIDSKPAGWDSLSPPFGFIHLRDGGKKSVCMAPLSLEK